MGQAVFLVTSLAGLRKTTFRNKVTALVSEGEDVTVLFAMVRFDEFEQAQRQLAITFKHHELGNHLHVQSLADLVKTSTGVALTPAETFNQDFLAFEQKTFDDAEFGGTVDRYVKDGEIFGEVIKDTDGIPLKMTQFDHNEIVQSAIFEKGQLIGLMNFELGHLSQSLLLNSQGELVYRFIRHMRTVNWLYSMGKTSKLNFSNQVPDEDSPNNRVVYRASEKKPFYEVVDHVSYHRLGDLYEFYAMVLRSFDQSGCQLFVDLDDNPDLVTHMPQQLIFNY
ncbi:hypothetical protein GPK34_06715 [Secundilactobacillus kimchicus]|uniref:hypothetical protein n=1 Tax=Secundilactobacillus kimchicus TaxID=528209 RepID=UPI001C009BAE|nr:hypothetical protein [Secundilactobacillus kimchicus]MBT9671720.1 hypothetical protein [Secundilactobacillus kimchicus]